MTKKKTKNEKPRPSIMIATPMYGGQCFGNYVHGLLATVQKMRSVNVPVYWSNLTNESLITRGRNELVRTFLAGKCDYLMFIDADVGFDGNAVATLLAADRDIACGMYPKKEINWEQIKRAVKNGKEDIEDYGGTFVFNMVSGTDLETDDDGMIEVRHGGTGFMLIKRRVFEELEEHVQGYRIASNKDADGEYVQPYTLEYFFTDIDATGALLSEDYAFCELWREHGGKIYACPFIKLDHVGTYIYNGDILKSGGKML